MNVMISLTDLFMFILFVIIIVVCVFLIALMRRAFCVLGYVRCILNAHHEDIGQVLAKLPQTLDNVNELSVSLRQTADVTTCAFRSLQEDMVDTVDDLRDGLDTFMTYARLINLVWKTVFSKLF